MSSRAAGSRSLHANLSLAGLDAPATRGHLLVRLCAAALLVAGGVHLAVGLEHAGSNFGTLSFVAGIAQMALGMMVFRRASPLVWRAVVVLSGILIQLYVLNVTVGLPPMISHSHIGGNHQIWLFTLAWPGLVEPHGVIAVTTQLVSLVCALWLASRRVATTS